MRSDNLKRVLAVAALAIGLWLILIYFAQPSRPAASGGLPAGSSALAPDEATGPLPAAEELGIVLPREATPSGSTPGVEGPDLHQSSLGRYRAPTPEQKEQAQEMERLQQQGIVVY